MFPERILYLYIYNFSRDDYLGCIYIYYYSVDQM